MIEMPQIDIAPPEECVRTPKESRPEPESAPLDIWEIDKFLEVPNGTGEKDTGVLFSGGDDSLALTHWVMERNLADWVVHLETQTSIPANLDYVRQVCEKYGWPLIVVSAPITLEQLAMRYSFPGPQAHQIAYNYLKGRQLGYLYRRTNGGIKFFSGVRTAESDRRMSHINAEVEYATPGSDNFGGWWISPLISKSDRWVEDYREQHSLPRNPVAASSLHRSGDCNCMAYGHRTEELVALEADWPEVADWLKNTETRVQEYRGRLDYLNEHYPDVAAVLDTKRKQRRPHPMRLTILQDESPSVYEEVVAVDVDEAVTRGQSEPQNFVGHGGLSSSEMRSLMAAVDTGQQTLCENCSGPADGVGCAVERRVAQAEEALAGSGAAESKQSALSVGVPEKTHQTIEESTQSDPDSGYEQVGVERWA